MGAIMKAAAVLRYHLCVTPNGVLARPCGVSARRGAGGRGVIFTEAAGFPQARAPSSRIMACQGPTPLPAQYY
ncbi:unnamed protein product, partial [Iphiclides podalirius]